MSPQNTTRSRRIVLSAARSEMAISLVDEAGALLQRAYVNEDGSCRLLQAALASADGVVVEPDNMFVDADRFRELIETGEPVDITELLAGGVRRATLRGHTPGNRPGSPSGGPPPGGGGYKHGTGVPG